MKKIQNVHSRLGKAFFPDLADLRKKDFLLLAGVQAVLRRLLLVRLAQ